MSSASNIYNLVGDIFGWQQMPETSSTGTFFGFSGMTKKVLIDAINALQANSAYLNFTSDSAANREFWFGEAYKDLLNEGKTNGAPKEGFIKWFNWLYVAAAKNQDVKDFFGGKPYSLTDYITSTISSKLTDVGETIEYGLEKESYIPDLLIPTTSNFWKWCLIGAGLLFVAKKIKL